MKKITQVGALHHTTELQASLTFLNPWAHDTTQTDMRRSVGGSANLFIDRASAFST